MPFTFDTVLPLNAMLDPDVVILGVDTDVDAVTVTADISSTLVKSLLLKDILVPVVVILGVDTDAAVVAPEVDMVTAERASIFVKSTPLNEMVEIVDEMVDVDTVDAVNVPTSVTSLFDNETEVVGEEIVAVVTDKAVRAPTFVRSLLLTDIAVPDDVIVEVLTVPIFAVPIFVKVLALKSTVVPTPTPFMLFVSNAASVAKVVTDSVGVVIEFAVIAPDDVISSVIMREAPTLDIVPAVNMVTSRSPIVAATASIDAMLFRFLLLKDIYVVGELMMGVVTEFAVSESMLVKSSPLNVISPVDESILFVVNVVDIDPTLTKFNPLKSSVVLRPIPMILLVTSKGVVADVVADTVAALTAPVTVMDAELMDPILLMSSLLNDIDVPPVLITVEASKVPI